MKNSENNKIISSNEFINTNSKDKETFLKMQELKKIVKAELLEEFRSATDKINTFYN